MVYACKMLLWLSRIRSKLGIHMVNNFRKTKGKPMYSASDPTLSEPLAKFMFVLI